MMNKVIGIEGLVGSGKTSISRGLVNIIPNSIILHGGNIYRAIVYGIMRKGIKIENIANDMKNVDISEIMDKLNIEIKLENKETIIFMDGKKVDENDLQSEKSSFAVSVVSNVANNSKLYEFGKILIDSFKKDYNVILSSRDIIKMYPEVDFHLFIIADLKERVNRKYIQYENRVSKKEIEENIIKRDTLQEQSGYYKIYDRTIVIDVTNCKTIEDSVDMVLKRIDI